MDINDKRELDVDLEGETIRLRVIALHENKREGVGIMLQTPKKQAFVTMGLQWGAFVQFAQFDEDAKPRLVRKIFELIGEHEWQFL